MKKYLVILSLLLLACSPQEDNYIEPVQSITQKLGLNLKNTVSDNTTFNVGVKDAGVYMLEIKNLNGELLSKSKLNLTAGNNEMSFYTKALGSQPLSVLLVGIDGTILANTKIGTR